jgi:hypothetical protein
MRDAYSVLISFSFLKVNFAIAGLECDSYVDGSEGSYVAPVLRKSSSTQWIFVKQCSALGSMIDQSIIFHEDH